jgi:curved DNA-binding protein CbpA
MSVQTAERDLYERLNVDPTASAHAVRSAYRLLAHRLHPDRNASPAAHRAMVQINDAYAVLRDPARRVAYDRERATPQPANGTKPSHQDAAGRLVVDFGRYRGWALEEIARQDPEYLEWLKRHSSGPRYRHEIDRVLAQRGSAPVTSSRFNGRARRR